MPNIALEIVIEDALWRRIPRLEARLKKAAQALHAQLPKHLRFSSKVTVLLTSDAKIRKLNDDFRGQDKATNVLSFPQFKPRKLPKKGKSRDEIDLGDIALGYQYIVGESVKYNKILINHVTHLFIHGILHLLGYDHGLVAEATRMERLEQKIMTGLGLPDPYLLQLKEPKVR